MSNIEIAQMFELLSKLMDIYGENSFKTKSYSTAAFRIEKYEKELSSMQESEIASILGIGDAISKKIIEILHTGSFKLFNEYLAKTPIGIIDLLGIKGLGPKKVQTLWIQLGIENIEDLEAAAKANQLIQLKGFTAKTQEDILHKIAFVKQSEGQFLWANAEPYASQLIELLKKHFPLQLSELTGDYRKQSPTIDMVEIITTIDLDNLTLLFSKIPNAVIDTKSSDQLSLAIPTYPVFLFHLCNEGNFYIKLWASSSSEAFIKAFTKQYTIPQYAKSEADIYEENKIQYIPPALRDDIWSLEAAQQSTLPILIQENDIKGLIHCHSKWSDGKFTIEEMAKAAMTKGLEYMIISDHSQSAFYANGLSQERIIQQHKEIDKLNQQLAPFKIFKSIEADILPNGQLDYDEDVLRRFDIVIASVHSILNMTEEKAMDRLLKAISNPYTHILGHLTGRLLLRREGYPINHQKIINACIDNKVVIEVNANPRRLDLDWSWIHYALKQGAMLSINPDAHSTQGIDDIRFGVLAAQKGGLTKEKNLSSLSLKEMEQFIYDLSS